MGIVFVAGVHAVGKTTACTSAASSMGAPHFSASGLIKAEKVNAIPQRGKAILDVEGNQELLIAGVRRVCKQHHGTVLLDGHFTLLKPDGRIEAIEVDVFRALPLDAIVVYHDDPKKIAERLSNRDKSLSDPVAIDRHQRRELDQAWQVAAKLNVPIKLLEAFDESSLIRLISERMAGEK